MNKLPRILQTTQLAATRLFHIEQRELEFSNGTVVNFERMVGSPHGAVLIVPVLNDDTLLLIREYAAGMHRYELAFPKGRIENDEPVTDAANRELMEEVGYAANDLQHIESYTLAPGYSNQQTHIVLARDLYPKQQQGDEPEPIEVVPWSMGDIPALVAEETFTEARSIAALYRVRELLSGE